ncbi:hypothetical protein SmJEL517_g03292 [Synchytrium microbalum]|uniref:Arsenical-resistance protein n=1 Tax=Synchytrium microbalum TaxID=1806994 RepID=A0A507C766_9FUNG|nr:uncharacterized protein SmJEL517_g03292 [Synchytrium microbalum]TPX33904.1 hypothetical protein SmJEL517_g03292 [Synchytrium microbalum]
MNPNEEGHPVSANGAIQDVKPTVEELPATAQLSLLDRYLYVWIFACMVLGVLIGVFVPSIQNILDSAQLVGVSVPVAVGLLVMMYPVLAKVKYETIPSLIASKHFVSYLALSILLNWILAPALMAALAWATLPDLPEYRAGLMLVGTARCIAMVLIWNKLAHGDAEWCAVLVAVNSILQVIFYGPLAYFYVVIVGQGPTLGIDMWLIFRSVLVFLGIPLVAGALTRLALRFSMRRSMTKEKWMATQARWYDDTFIPIIGPFALLGLLYTIVIIFALQGNAIIHNIGPVFRVVVPLLLYFGIVFISTIYICARLKVTFPVALTQSFTAASNNFELALAVAIATYGATSQVALAATIGPLVEVPVLLGLVYVSKACKKYYPVVDEVSDETVDQDSTVESSIEIPHNRRVISMESK